MDDWIDRNYDCFVFLTPEMRNPALQLQVPCYPVIFPSVNGKNVISRIIGEHDPYIHVFGRELTHLRAATVLMCFIVVVAILTSIAIVRRILMATSVLKCSARSGFLLLCIFSSLARLFRVTATLTAVHMISWKKK